MRSDKTVPPETDGRGEGGNEMRGKHHHYDCRQFTGYRPCPWDCECANCAHYRAKRPRVLVVRVHQLGNIVKSSPVAAALHKRYDDPWVAWLTGAAAAPLVRSNPLVNEVLTWSWESAVTLRQRRFDLVLSLEANAAEAALAQSIPAAERRGYGLHESGALMALDEASEAYVRLSVSDRLRFRENRKSLAELLFDLVGAPYEGEEYLLCPSEEERMRARAALRAAGVDPEREAVIALATGGDSARFPTKDWPPEHFAALARLLAERTNARIVLVGGPKERERNERLTRELGGLVVDTGCGHGIMEFCALLGECDVVVSGDCFPMHAAVAMKTPVVAVFGPTPPQETPIFGRGRQIVTAVECAPCYNREVERCPQGWRCMPGIAPERVAEAVLEVLNDS
jgi:heptosyltransferase-2